jgi:hypothetical protein
MIRVTLAALTLLAFPTVAHAQKWEVVATHGVPMTDKQMLHQRARYNRNPNTGLDEFAWVTVLNAKTSPPTMKETVADIRPGFAK